MVWQTEGMRTDWLRVMTPDGGGSADVRVNRGFVFIPEVGDHVLVGFRHGDPNRPYVMGSLFNGKTGGGEGNKCKSLTTRSGSSLKLDDSDGSVTLHDKGGVSMKFDGGGNQLLKANTSTTTSVGKGDASFLYMSRDGYINLAGDQQIQFSVGNSRIVIAPNKISITSPEIEVNGTTKVNVQGGTTNVTTTTINLQPQSAPVEEGVPTISAAKAVNIEATFVDIKRTTVDIN